jgi:hypothetical protein
VARATPSRVEVGAKVDVPIAQNGSAIPRNVLTDAPKPPGAKLSRRAKAMPRASRSPVTLVGAVTTPEEAVQTLWAETE